MKPRFKRLGREDGQALVELAFVLPLLLLFLFAIIDFGLALNQYNTNTNIANLAARTVSVLGTKTSATCGGTSYSTLTGWVDCEAKATGEPVPKSVCVSDTAGSSSSSSYAAGDPVKVEVTSTFNWFSMLSSGNGYIGRVVNPTSDITASATMRLEQAPKNGTSSFLTPTCGS